VGKIRVGVGMEENFFFFRNNKKKMKKTKNNKKKERKKNADLALVLIGNKKTLLNIM
jgi:hypothetical protein